MLGASLILVVALAALLTQQAPTSSGKTTCMPCGRLRRI
jgi:hypothetical protein